jgi:hypothetical protein
MTEVLKPVRPLFLEEPLRMENIDAMAGLRHKAQVPIATGECLYTKYEFRQLLAKEAADIIQPDICLAGGVLEQKKIAAMAEAHYVMVAPHNPLGPLATLVNVHFAASTPNFLILEYQPDDRLAKGSHQGRTHPRQGRLPADPRQTGWATRWMRKPSRLPAQPWHRGFALRRRHRIICYWLGKNGKSLRISPSDGRYRIRTTRRSLAARIESAYAPYLQVRRSAPETSRRAFAEPPKSGRRVFGTWSSCCRPRAAIRTSARCAHPLWSFFSTTSSIDTATSGRKAFGR